MPVPSRADLSNAFQRLGITCWNSSSEVPEQDMTPRCLMYDPEMQTNRNVLNKSSFSLLICVVALFAAMSCASHPKTARPPRQPFDEAKIFAPGDCFELEVRGYPYEFTIAEDGTITLPLFSERVKVAGLTPPEIRKLVSESYRPDGPSERDVKVLQCFKPIADDQNATARTKVENIAKNAARKRGWNGELKTLVMMRAPYQRVPETADQWLIRVWEERLDGGHGRSAVVMISLRGKVISFSETSLPK